MKFFALSQRSGETYDAAGKAMHDVFTILAQKGCKTIWSMPKSCSKYMKILDLPYLAVFLLLNAGKKDSIFYSIPENHIKIKLLKKMQKIKKYNIICFINDLNAFRYGNANDPIVQQKMKEEAKIIGVADFVLDAECKYRGALKEKRSDVHADSGRGLGLSDERRAGQGVKRAAGKELPTCKDCVCRKSEQV